MPKKSKQKLPTINGYQFIQIPAEVLESNSYRALTPLARCLLTEFLIIYRPSRNGYLSISTLNAAARLNVTENTARKAFPELLDHGFLKLFNVQCWQQRKAREFAITFLPVNRSEPTDEWRIWADKKPRPENLRLVASNIQVEQTQKLR